MAECGGGCLGDLRCPDTAAGDEDGREEIVDRRIVMEKGVKVPKPQIKKPTGRKPVVPVTVEVGK